TANGKVDREKLARQVLNDPAALARLEGIVHPLVHAAEKELLAQARVGGKDVVVLDIPLLFETGAGRRVGARGGGSAPAQEQRTRAWARPGMTAEKLEAVLAKQMPDSEKRRRADFVVDSSRGFDVARAEVRAILKTVATMPKRRRDSP